MRLTPFQNSLVTYQDFFIISNRKSVSLVHQNNANNTKFFDSNRLGGQSSDKENREIVFLITPVIIDEEEYFEESA